MRRTSPIACALALLGCGGATPPSTTTPTSNANEPQAGPAVAELAPPPPPAYPLQRVVLVDGVRGAGVLDQLGGFSLVGGAGTIALVGPDGHVRASHRFAFGADGATGVFLGTGPRAEEPSHAVVGNGDQDGFRGPWAGELDRWNIDEDVVEQLTHLGYGAPLLARVGAAVVAVNPSEGSLHGVTLGGVEDRPEPADRVG